MILMLFDNGQPLVNFFCGHNTEWGSESGDFKIIIKINQVYFQQIYSYNLKVYKITLKKF